MNDCIFCKIIKREVPSEIIWEDDKHIAILDINPNVKGMTLVIPKDHLDSDVLNLTDNELTDLMKAVKTVSKLLKISLDVERVGVAFEGVGVDHAHVKLYPMIGWKSLDVSDDASDNVSMDKSTEVFFDKYPGYLTTKLGPKYDLLKLSELANKIRSFIK